MNLSSRAPRLLAAASVTAVLAIAGAACGGDDGNQNLSEAGARGKDVANANGCASCHGSNGQGGAGPTWVELAGSNVELADGSLVVADHAYLVRSIVEPDVELRAGYTLRMPVNGLTDEQVADVIAYIEDLSPETIDG